MTSPIAPAETDTARLPALAAIMPDYCAAVARLYPGYTLQWGLSPIDGGVDIILVYNARIGHTVRSIEPLGLGWAIYTGEDSGFELLETDADLTRLVLRATAALALDAPEWGTLH